MYKKPTEWAGEAPTRPHTGALGFDEEGKPNTVASMMKSKL